MSRCLVKWAYHPATDDRHRPYIGGADGHRLATDGSRQALADFVTTSPRNPAHIRARLTWRVHHAFDPTALIINGASFLAGGSASAVVARQFTGAAGKTPPPPIFFFAT